MADNRTATTGYDENATTEYDENATTEYDENATTEYDESEDDDPRSRTRRGAKIFLIILAVVVVAGIAFAIFWFISWLGEVGETEEPKTAATETVEAENADAEWAVQYYDRSKGLDRADIIALAGGIDPNLPAAEAMQLMLAEAKVHPEVLDAYLYATFDEGYSLSPKKLTDDPEAFDASEPCNMNKQAKNWYFKLEGAWTSQAAEVKKTKAPKTGTNSGSNGKTVNKSASSGISGDRTAIRVKTWKKGRTIYIMYRCGNIVWTGSTRLPKGDTDEDLKKKSSDPANYSRPPKGERPSKVTNPTSPGNKPAKKPPKVKGPTVDPDKPNSKPGDPTDVPAPTKGPVDEDRDNPPPNEGGGGTSPAAGDGSGSNDTDPGGFS